MITSLKILIISLSVLLLIHSCFEPYDNKDENFKPNLIVDAEISDTDTSHIIKISEAQKTDIQTFKGYSGAKVLLKSNENDELVFSETTTVGHYKYIGVLNDAKGYALEVQVNGKVVVTSPIQYFPESFMVDSLRNYTEYVRTQKPNGSVFQEYIVNFNAEARKPTIEKEVFVRFDIETVFLVLELICSPFISPKTCYVYNHRSNFEINLLKVPVSTSEINISQKIFSKTLDYEFGGAFSVKADVKSYNQENFKYWQQYKSVFDQSGSVDDLIPARISGNLTSSSGNVLGLFSLVRKSSVFKIIRRGEAGGRSVEPYCGTPGFYEPWPRPSECCECLRFANSTLTKPYYW
ncbi:MAG: DUF4249 family protein [Saprospiraceae bacterium]|nr:DUF4249 family protein [Saprospiraceae bacterium]